MDIVPENRAPMRAHLPCGPFTAATTARHGSSRSVDARHRLAPLPHSITAIDTSQNRTLSIASAGPARISAAGPPAHARSSHSPLGRGSEYVARRAARLAGMDCARWTAPARLGDGGGRRGGGAAGRRGR